MNVQLTPNHRLTADDRNFIVTKRITVDPTKAPGFRQRYEADPTIKTDIHETWREVAYYPLTTAGLTSAINYAVIRAGSEKDTQSITELFTEFRHSMERISAQVDAVFAYVAPAPVNAKSYD